MTDKFIPKIGINEFFEKEVKDFTYHDCEKYNGSKERIRWIWYELKNNNTIYHSPYGEDIEDCKKLAYIQTKERDSGELQRKIEQGIIK